MATTIVEPTGADGVSWTTRRKEEGQRRWLKVRLSDSRTEALVSSRRAMAKTCFFTCRLATVAVSTSYAKDNACLSRWDKGLRAHVRRALASSRRKRPDRKTPRSSSDVVREPHDVFRFGRLGESAVSFLRLASLFLGRHVPVILANSFHGLVDSNRLPETGSQPWLWRRANILERVY